MKDWKKPELSLLGANQTKGGGFTTDPDGGVLQTPEQTLLLTES